LNFKHTRDSLIANLSVQSIGIVTFLLIPNILSKEQYAQIIYMGVLFSFASLAHLGIPFVYTIIMPRLYYKNEELLIKEHDQTFFWFIASTAFLCSILMSIIHYLKFQNIYFSLLIVILYPAYALVNFFLSRLTIKSDFKKYKNATIKRSFATFIIIPFTFFFNTLGWIFARIITELVVIFSSKEFTFPKFTIKFSLLKDHFIDGFFLVGNFVFYSQLLDCAKLYASSFYDIKVLSQYGLVASGFAIFTGLLGAYNVPETIEILRTIKDEPSSRIDKMMSTLYITLPMVLFLIILADLFTPYLYRLFFPKYHLNTLILSYYLYSGLFLPMIIYLNAIFSGMQKISYQFFISLFSFLLSYFTVFMLRKNLNIESAALAQFITVTLFSFILLLSAFIIFSEVISHKIRKLFLLVITSILPLLIYIFAKRLLLGIPQG